MELLQIEVKDVREREQNQAQMYKKIIEALKAEIDTIRGKGYEGNLYLLFLSINLFIPHLYLFLMF